MLVARSADNQLYHAFLGDIQGGLSHLARFEIDRPSELVGVREEQVEQAGLLVLPDPQPAPVLAKSLPVEGVQIVLVERGVLLAPALLAVASLLAAAYRSVGLETVEPLEEAAVDRHPVLLLIERVVSDIGADEPPDEDVDVVVPDCGLGIQLVEVVVVYILGDIGDPVADLPYLHHVLDPRRAALVDRILAEFRRRDIQELPGTGDDWQDLVLGRQAAADASYRVVLLVRHHLFVRVELLLRPRDHIVAVGHAGAVSPGLRREAGGTGDDADGVVVGPHQKLVQGGGR